MLVVDASAVAEFLLGSARGRAAETHLRRHERALHIPHLAVVEVASVVRAWVLRGTLAPERAAGALADLAEFPARRWPAEPFLPRILALRDNVTAYDATYVALAEGLDADLLTGDVRLARAVAAVSSSRVLTLS